MLFLRSTAQSVHIHKIAPRKLRLASFAIQGHALQQGILNAVQKETAEEHHSMETATAMLSAAIVGTAATINNSSAPVSPCPSTYSQSNMCVLFICLPCNGSNFFKQLDYVRNLIISQAGNLNFHYIIPSDRRLRDTGSRPRSPSHVFEWLRCSNSSQWCQRKGLWNRLPLGVSSFDIA